MIKPDAYKHKRGMVEIHAGSTGHSGAARLAARGAQAAGAGLVALMVDQALYPALLSAFSGVMIAPALSPPGENGFFRPEAVLLGPGWGGGTARRRAFEAALTLEAEGIPLVLDADALPFAKDTIFHGNAILTPHPGECAALIGLPKEELLASPLEPLREASRGMNAVIILKGHVIFVAAPDGRLGVIDGMAPALATGGSGDLLAGFCAAAAARNADDLYGCAVSQAALLIAAAKDPRASRRFCDPEEIAGVAARLAGEAWLTR